MATYSSVTMDDNIGFDALIAELDRLVRAADRRALLGRHVLPVDRPLRARGCCGRRHRPHAQRRPHPHSGGCVLYHCAIQLRD